jgi:hypothetical protein
MNRISKMFSKLRYYRYLGLGLFESLPMAWRASKR